jgi:hypothetical protein
MADIYDQCEKYTARDTFKGQKIRSFGSSISPTTRKSILSIQYPSICVRELFVRAQISHSFVCAFVLQLTRWPIRRRRLTDYPLTIHPPLGKLAPPNPSLPFNVAPFNLTLSFPVPISQIFWLSFDPSTETIPEVISLETSSTRSQIVVVIIYSPKSGSIVRVAGVVSGQLEHSPEKVYMAQICRLEPKVRSSAVAWVSGCQL